MVSGFQEVDNLAYCGGIDASAKGKIMSNYYEWQFGNKCESVAMDAQVMREHPDGSPCYAKREEDCPIINKAKKVDRADDLTNVENKSARQKDPMQSIVARHLAELESIAKDPEVAKVFPTMNGMTYGELEAAYQDVEDEYAQLEKTIGSGYQRGTRKRAKEIAAAHPEADCETYGMDGHNREDELEGLDAWGVTFNTSKMDDPRHPTFVDDDNYDKKVAILNKVSMADGPQVGIFQHKPEISVACPDTKKAVVQMVMFEQCGIYNYKYGRTLFNPTYSEEVNPKLDRENSHIVERK